MRKLVIAAAALLLAASSVPAAASLTEQEIRDKARQILLGDPYGTTPEEIANNIKDVQLVSDGKTKACPPLNTPVWQVHVVVEKPVTSPDKPINGYMAIDAESGTMLCANLPMLD